MQGIVSANSGYYMFVLHKKSELSHFGRDGRE